MPSTRRCPSILDRISRQVNMRYRAEGKTIVVGPDTPYMKTYKVDYVNMTRETQIDDRGERPDYQPGRLAARRERTAPGGGTSSTSVTTNSKNNFWEVLHDNIRSILSLDASADAKRGRAPGTGRSRTCRPRRADCASRRRWRAPARAPRNLFQTAFGSIALLRKPTSSRTSSSTRLPAPFRSWGPNASIN